MKKLLLILALVASVTFARAATISVVCPATSVTNLLGITQSGAAVITSVSITALTATNALISLYDSSTGYMTNVIPATTSISSYATNYIQCWTNYYQVRNCWTNISLVQQTNTVAGTTNSANIVGVIAASANGTTTQSPVSYLFERGVWATNGSFGAVGITITYQH